MSSQFRITFIDRNEKNLKALENSFGNVNKNIFSFIRGDFVQSIQADSSINCIVSPANSFGLMDGGLDWYINRYLFPLDRLEISEYVKQKIIQEYSGEQPVGTCLLVYAKAVDDRNFILAHTPTMRVPKDVSNTDNAYLAFKALLNSVNNYNKVTGNKNPIRNIACSSFCTGVGDMPHDRAGKQMRLAYDHFIEGQTLKTHDMEWRYADKINKEIQEVSGYIKPKFINSD